MGKIKVAMIECDVCGRKTEGFQLTKTGKKLLFFNRDVTFGLCQGCVSRAFKNFQKER